MEHEIDPYRILQVDPTAEDVVIQAAYRALMKRHHPDRGGAREVAQELNAAYALVGSARARQTYERLRRERERARTPRPPDVARPSGAGPGTAWIQPLSGELGEELLRRFAPVTDVGPGWLFDFAGSLREAPRHRIWMKRFRHRDTADARVFVTMIEATRLARPLWSRRSDAFVAVVAGVTDTFRDLLRAPRGPCPSLGYAILALDLHTLTVHTAERGRALRSVTALKAAVAAAR